MSFVLTTPQILNRTKTVTRRLGWASLKPGTLIQAIEKGQGLKKGEKVRRLTIVRVSSVRREPLNRMLKPYGWAGYTYGVKEAVREGFREMSPAEFVAMFCRANRCDPSVDVTRIEFEYVDANIDEPARQD